MTVATILRSSRWRRAFLAACLPYLFLSVFVDSLHVHPPWSGDSGLSVSVNERVAAPDGHSARLPHATCAICQWLRAGTGLHAPLAPWPTDLPLRSALALASPVTPDGLTLLSPDFCGPPSLLV